MRGIRFGTLPPEFTAFFLFLLILMVRSLLPPQNLSFTSPPYIHPQKVELVTIPLDFFYSPDNIIVNGLLNYLVFRYKESNYAAIAYSF